MPLRVHSRQVEEQPAEALSTLGAAALKQAFAGLTRLLDACSNRAHRKFLIWLWTEGYVGSGSISFEHDAPGMRISLAIGGSDLRLEAGGTELRVDIDPITPVKGRYALSRAIIAHDGRAAAANLLKHLERVEAKRVRWQAHGKRRDG